MLIKARKGNTTTGVATVPPKAIVLGRAVPSPDCQMSVPPIPLSPQCQWPLGMHLKLSVSVSGRQKAQYRYKPRAAIVSKVWKGMQLSKGVLVLLLFQLPRTHCPTPHFCLYF